MNRRFFMLDYFEEKTGAGFLCAFDLNKISYVKYYPTLQKLELLADGEKVEATSEAALAIWAWVKANAFENIKFRVEGIKDE